MMRNIVTFVFLSAVTRWRYVPVQRKLLWTIDHYAHIRATARYICIARSAY